MNKLAQCVLLLIVISGLMVGCATIISGTKATVEINSTPDNANVTIKSATGFDVASGTTPFNTDLSVKDDYMVTVTMDGYEEKTIRVAREFNTWVIGNIICGGIPGLIIDFISGAINTLQPNQIMVMLEKTDSADMEGDMMIAVYMCDENGDVYKYTTELVPVLP